jgi:hypothetical protein
MFWNCWGSDCNRLKLIVCGSATTWMINKLLGDKGGLHNRVTMPICLSPFTLHETSQYLTYMGFDWSDMEVIETYMVLGGVPYYLSLLSPSLSLRQNIDNLFFKRNAVLKTEYDFLFNSLYSEAQAYKKVVELLSSKMIGMTRSEMMSNLKILDNGFFSSMEYHPIQIEKCSTMTHLDAKGHRIDDAYIEGIQIQAAIMGAEAGNPFVGKVLEWYKDKHFVKEDGSLRTDLLSPYIYARVAEEYGFIYKDIDQQLKDNVHIFPSETRFLCSSPPRRSFSGGSSLKDLIF